MAVVSTFKTMRLPKPTDRRKRDRSWVIIPRVCVSKIVQESRVLKSLCSPYCRHCPLSERKNQRKQLLSSSISSALWLPIHESWIDDIALSSHNIKPLNPATTIFSIKALTALPAPSLSDGKVAKFALVVERWRKGAYFPFAHLVRRCRSS